MKKFLVIMMTILMMVVSVTPVMSEGGESITIRTYMNEQNSNYKVLYSYGLIEGIVSTYAVMAISNDFDEEQIRVCVSNIDASLKSFKSYDVLVNQILMKHLDAGGKTSDLLSIVISNELINNESCITTKEVNPNPKLKM